MKPSKQTKRKFYGKWLYKVSLDLPGAALFRFNLPKDILAYIDEHTDTKNRYVSSYVREAKTYRDCFVKYLNTISTYAKDLYAVRIESRTLDIYTNEQALFDEMSFNCTGFIRSRFEPSKDTIDIVNQPYKIAANKLPHNIYQHKVFLLPHKLADDPEGKKRYLSWVDTQGDKIKISNATKQWFLDTNWNWDRRYVYVDSEQTLLMLKLRNPDVVGRVYDYVVVDK